MAITDELRKYARGYETMVNHKLLAIADRIDAELAERYVELPKDADGECIHIGDELVLQRKVWEKPYVVQGITWDGEDWYFTCDEGFFNAAGWIHYHTPTVEDVLCELLDKVDDDRAGQAEIIAEYAKRLQLRDDAE